MGGLWPPNELEVFLISEVETLMAQIETLNLSSVCYTIGTGIFVGFISAVFISWHIGVFAERINSRFISWLLTFVTLYAVHFLIVFLVTLAMSAGQSIL